MESMPGPGHSNGSAHGSSAAIMNGYSRPGNNDSEEPVTPVSPSNATGISNIASPPFWTHSHRRTVSSISIESVAPGAITLQDNTDGRDDKNEACWAKGVHIDDYVVINGNRTGIGAFVVWNVTVETLTGGTIRIRKRYSEFDDLRNKLLQTFPLSEAAMPPLPPKGVIAKFRPKFLEQRRIGLSYFLNCILLNPEFSGSPVLKEFLFE